jgi:betaine-homocysteine S-methyltransferase
MAEGYIFELEKRGYVSAGPFCPEVLLENPEVIK